MLAHMILLVTVVISFLQCVEGAHPARLVELGLQNAWYLEYEIVKWREQAVLKNIRENPRTWLETIFILSLTFYAVYQIALVLTEARKFTFTRGDEPRPSMDLLGDEKEDSCYESDINEQDEEEDREQNFDPDHEKTE